MFEVDCIFHCNNVSNHKGLGVCRFIGKLQGFATFRVGPTLSGAFMLDVVLADRAMFELGYIFNGNANLSVVAYRNS